MVRFLVGYIGGLALTVAGITCFILAMTNTNGSNAIWYIVGLAGIVFGMALQEWGITGESK